MIAGRIQDLECDSQRIVILAVTAVMVLEGQMSRGFFEMASNPDEKSPASADAGLQVLCDGCPPAAALQLAGWTAPINSDSEPACMVRRSVRRCIRPAQGSELPASRRAC